METSIFVTDVAQQFSLSVGGPSHPIVVPLRVARTSVTGRSSTVTASARALLGLWLLERSLTWVYSPFALIPTTPPPSLSIHWARSSSLMLMQRAHGLLIGSRAMPDDTDIDDTTHILRRMA